MLNYVRDTLGGLLKYRLLKYSLRFRKGSKSSNNLTSSIDIVINSN